MDADTRQAAKAHAKAGNWRKLFQRLPKSARLIRYTIIAPHLTPSEASSLLGWVWVNGEKFRLEHYAIEKLFEGVHSDPTVRGHLMEPDELEVFNQIPASEVDVYRGAEDQESLDGWSWSLDPESARRFAAGDGYLRHGRCDKNAIIAYKRGPDDEPDAEDEVIVDPRQVRPMTTEVISSEAP